MNEDQTTPAEFSTGIGARTNTVPSQEGDNQSLVTPIAIGLAEARRDRLEDYYHIEIEGDEEDDDVDMVMDAARRNSTEKAMLEATLTNLRNKLNDVEKDNWMYEGPRYSYK